MVFKLRVKKEQRKQGEWGKVKGGGSKKLESPKGRYKK